jgi:large subunit ribosomal protein L31
MSSVPFHWHRRPSGTYIQLIKLIGDTFRTAWRRGTVKEKIHPNYKPAKFTCSCGNVIEVNATIGDRHIEICNECHPFYTGKQKLIDSAGRVDRFRKRYQKTGAGS